MRSTAPERTSMNNEAIQPAAAPVAATAFGEETQKIEFDLCDPRLTQEAPRTEITLPYELKCVLSRSGKPCFRRSDTAIGTVLMCPHDAPAELVGKVGHLTIAVLAGTKLAPTESGFVMPTKPVNFVRFDA